MVPISGSGLGRVLGVFFGMLFDGFSESFWILLGASGPPLGDFWRFFAALGIVCETFVWLWVFFSEAVKVRQALCFRNIWALVGRFLKSFGCLRATFGRLLVKWTPK